MDDIGDELALDLIKHWKQGGSSFTYSMETEKHWRGINNNNRCFGSSSNVINVRLLGLPFLHIDLQNITCSRPHRHKTRFSNKTPSIHAILPHIAIQAINLAQTSN
jgi:hypothetical protein